MSKTPHIPARTKMGCMTEKGEMSRAEHMEHHVSDGQRHAEGRFKIQHQEAMHEKHNTGK
jgi:hypothetical protein